MGWNENKIYKFKLCPCPVTSLQLFFCEIVYSISLGLCSWTEGTIGWAVITIYFQHLWKTTPSVLITYLLQTYTDFAFNSLPSVYVKNYRKKQIKLLPEIFLAPWVPENFFCFIGIRALLTTQPQLLNFFVLIGLYNNFPLFTAEVRLATSQCWKGNKWL